MPNQRGHSHLAGEKILVTGAAGHIGQELCRALNAAGNELIATDISSEAAGPGDSLASVPITSCDLRKSEEVRRLLAAESVSRVIHLAGVLPSA
jgi:nucleoside-diphosphate-sugar epimerase